MTKKRSKTIKLYWWRSISEMHVIILRFIVRSFNPFEMLFFCTPKLHLGVTAISTSVSAVVFLLVGVEHQLQPKHSLH